MRRSDECGSTAIFWASAFAIVQLNRLQRQPVGKPHIVIASTDRKPQFAVVVAIVWKQALRVNGQPRTTVVSVANKSVVFDFSSHRRIDAMREKIVSKFHALTTVPAEQSHITSHRSIY
jgi:hypothetical protein